MISRVSVLQNKKQPAFKSGYALKDTSLGVPQIIPMDNHKEKRNIISIIKDVLDGKFQYYRTNCPRQFCAEDLFISAKGDAIASGVEKGRTPYINTILGKDNGVLHHYDKEKQGTQARLVELLRDALEKVKSVSPHK